jgi:hypothetical protein
VIATSNQKRTLGEPAIRALVTGLRRGTKFYYRSDPITHMPVAFPAHSELMKLGMSPVTATRLLREAVEAGLIREMIAMKVAPSPEDGEAAPANVAAPEAGDSEEEDEDDAPNESGTHCRKAPLGLSDVLKGELDRYELVKTGSGFYGYYDTEHDREVIIGRNKESVLELIFGMRRGEVQPVVL